MHQNLHDVLRKKHVERPYWFIVCVSRLDGLYIDAPARQFYV
jgi:hypothetical protein